MSVLLTQSAGFGTPELRPISYTPSSPLASDYSERLEVVERRLEKAERMLSIGEELGKLKQDLDEIRQAELLRRLEDLEDRVKKIEKDNSSYFITLEARVEANSLRLDSLAAPSFTEELSQLKQDLVQLSAKSKNEAWLKFEKDIQTQLFSVCLTLEEVASIAHRTERRQRDLETTFSRRSPSPTYRVTQEQPRTRMPEQANSIEDEEFFLKAISSL